MAKTKGGRTLNIDRQPVQLFMYVPQLCSSDRIRKLINSSPKQFLSISKCTLFSFVQIPPISHPITTGVFSSSINQPNSTSTSIKPLFLGFRSDHSMASQSSNPQSIHDFTVKVGLKGEGLCLYTGSSSLWMSQSTLPTKQPLIWYKTTFDVPTGDDPIALDMSGLGKGEAWVNGQSIGLYWPTYTAPKSGCTDFCNYRGSYSSRKCLENRGKPTQQFYHVPRSWLKPSGNILVLFEDSGGSTT